MKDAVRRDCNINMLKDAISIGEMPIRHEGLQMGQVGWAVQLISWGFGTEDRVTGMER